MGRCRVPAAIISMDPVFLSGVPLFKDGVPAFAVDPCDCTCVETIPCSEACAEPASTVRVRTYQFGSTGFGSCNPAFNPYSDGYYSYYGTTSGGCCNIWGDPASLSVVACYDPATNTTTIGWVVIANGTNVSTTVAGNSCGNPAAEIAYPCSCDSLPGGHCYVLIG